jgi:hypothetical protein
MIPDKYKKILYENQYLLEVKNLGNASSELNKISNDRKDPARKASLSINLKQRKDNALTNEILAKKDREDIEKTEKKVGITSNEDLEEPLDEDIDDDSDDYEFYKNDKGETDFDESNINNYLITETTILHEDFSQNLHPFFVVLSTVFSPFNKIYRATQHCSYGHAACSLSPDLNEIFSFSVGIQNNLVNKHNDGFTIENLAGYQVYNKDEAYMSVLLCFLKDNEFNKLVNILDYYRNNPNTRYKVDNLLQALLQTINGNANKLSDAMICSQFVAALFDYIGFGNLNSKTVMTPDMIYKNYSNSNNFYEVYKGLIKDYNVNKVKKILNKVKKNAVPLGEDYLIPIDNKYKKEDWFLF